jgi:acyl carrier protein
MQQLELELKKLIVETLMLEDVAPDDIDPEAPLFVDGLGLDSIDALELSMAVNNAYGVKIEADDETNRKIFGSVRALATYVHEHRPGNVA